MKNLLKKAKNVLKNDGLSVFFERSFNYSIVKTKRVFSSFGLENINRIKNLKGTYKKKRVFLLGNGPSLNRTPLHLLKNEYKMCCNRFNLFFERLDWFPDFYIAIDDLVIKDAYKEINNEIIPNVKLSFFPDIHPSNVEIKNKLIRDRENILWLNTDKPGFSLNLPQCGINKTIINPGLQILAYLGFEKIYLLGVDMTFEDQKVKKSNSRDWTAEKDDDPNHFDPRYFGKSRSYHNPTVHEMLDTLAEGKKFFDEHNVKVYNATIGGKLEVFPRKNFRELFKYNEKEELELFLKSCNIKANHKSFEIAFKDAKYIESYDEWDDTYPQVVVDVNIGIKLINKVIFTHIPHGPFKEKYIFIKRNQNQLKRENEFIKEKITK